MKKIEKVVSVRFADADYRKLQHTAERNGSNVAAELRAIVADRMRWNDQHAQISSDLKATMEAVALSLLPMLMEQMQIQNGKSPQAQAPVKGQEPWINPLENPPAKKPEPWVPPAGLTF